MFKPTLLSIGVDQTGATRLQGKAFQPLPAARAGWVRGSDASGIRVEVLEPHSQRPFRLSAFEESELLKLGQGFELPEEYPRVLVDGVLGLPFDITSQNHQHATLRESLQQAQIFFESRALTALPARGRQAAEDFFSEILSAYQRTAPSSGGGGLPTREAERLAGANSVFLSRPYQKNVQTGTYRIWVELAKWLSDSGRSARVCFPHHDDSTLISRQKWRIEESWPSLLWRTLLMSPVRAPSQLPVLLENLQSRLKIRVFCSKLDLEYCALHPDHADALVLALGGLLLPESVPLGLAGEGWITGLVKT